MVVAANLSALDLLNRDLVGLVERLLDESALPADRLCLEITESALRDEPELALQHLKELAALDHPAVPRAGSVGHGGGGRNGCGTRLAGRKCL